MATAKAKLSRAPARRKQPQDKTGVIGVAVQWVIATINDIDNQADLDAFMRGIGAASHEARQSRLDRNRRAA